MKRTWASIILLIITAVIPFSRAISQADKTTQVPETAAAPLPHLATNPQQYIIQLSAPPLARLMRQAQPTAVSQYQQYLDAQQASFVAALSQNLGRPIEPLYRYTVAYNGLTVSLNGAEAVQVTKMPGVTAVIPDREENLLTDAGPAWINANTIWDGSGVPGGLPGKGEGIIIGVIDTGINMDHPSFAAVGGDGYTHQNPLGSGNYKGVCDPGSSQYDPAFTCNAKLIGAWDFADLYGESDGPEDSNGHGSHTASTAAGNMVNAALSTPTGFSYQSDISGVAPHANIIAYDACVTGCPSSALLAAVNQAVADGVDVISYSISGGDAPYTDPVEQAFLAANEAGIVVSAAAGNSGPDPSSLNHQSPWVMTVGASTHNRVFRNSLSHLGSSDGPLADIAGQSLTAGYGPAPIVYAGDFGDAQCLNAFPPGTWNGEIVVCDRGTIARVQKAENVLAGGAGGYVLANTAVEGDSLNSDAYALPGVHITYVDALVLHNWLASGSNHQAQIGGTTAVLSNADADKMASFSSRGPNTAMDVIKPDIVAPGVNIFAADKTTQLLSPPEYQLLSGTSMATPHLSGAAALLRQVQPTWSPDELRSAMMMTAVSSTIRKESGQTPADPFDRGAGRVDLSRAARAGLVLHETRANYEAAENGDPTSLNLPTLMQSDCQQSCTWSRTFRSTLNEAATWTGTAETPDGVQVSLTPSQFSLQPGQQQTVQITADLSGYPASSGWAFATLVLSSPGQESLRLPIAVLKNTATNPAALSKSAPAYAAPDAIITYEITLDNLEAISRTFQLTDTLPAGVTYVPGSATGGLVYEPLNRQLTWQGEIGPGTMGYEITAVTPWIPYVNLGELANPPANLCDLFANCDDTAVQFDLAGEQITFYQETLNQLFVSSNGLVYGPEGYLGLACSACPQRLPNAVELNQVMAGLWRDMDASNGFGQWYGALLDGWLPNDTVFYANWHEVAQAGDPFLSSSHAVAVVLDGQTEPDGRIYYTYQTISDPDRLMDAGYTIGVENKSGTLGQTVAFAPCADSACLYAGATGTPPANGTTYRLDPAIIGGVSAQSFTYQVRVTAPAGSLVSNQAQAGNDGSPELLTAVADTLVEYRTYFPIVAKFP